MSMPGIRFGWWKLPMPEEIQLVMPDLASEVGALAHLACDGNTCTETGPFTSFYVPVACTKLDILGHSNKVGKGLDCICRIVSLSVLETGPYNIFEIVCLIVLRRLRFFWDKKVTRRLDSGSLRRKGLLFRILCRLGICDLHLLHCGRCDLRSSRQSILLASYCIGISHPKLFIEYILIHAHINDVIPISRVQISL